MHPVEFIQICQCQFFMLRVDSKMFQQETTIPSKLYTTQMQHVRRNTDLYAYMNFLQKQIAI